MKKLLIIILSICTGHFAKAQYKFNDETSSSQYDAKITVANYSGTFCSGPGIITLSDKITKEKTQVFTSADLTFSLTENQHPETGEINLGKYQSPLIFGDFNFDGIEDVAIRNGHNNIYNGASYTVYLYHVNKKKFVLNKELTDLATNNMGMFAIDRKNKSLTITQKEACCYYKDITYKVSASNKPYFVQSVIEDSSIGEDVTVITQKIVDGKLKKTVQKYKTKDYYRQ